MPRFFSCFRILVVLTAVAVVKTETQGVEEGAHNRRIDQGLETEMYVLMDGVRSSLFSQCVEAMNTFEGSLYSIAVDEGVEYVRFDASGSNRTISWARESGIPDTVECAFEAYERGAYMFKFTSSAGCQLALDNAYDRSQQGCEGAEIVYMTTGDFCMNSKNAYKVGETTDDFCPKNCTEDGFIYAEPRSDEYVYFPEPGCCFGSSEDIDRCILVDSSPLTMCQTEDLCSAASLRIYAMDSAEAAEYGFDMVAKHEGYTVWVSIYKDNSNVWRYLVSDELVDTALWGPGEPSDAGRCAVITPNRYIAARACHSEAGKLCEEPFPDFPICGA